MNPLRVLWQLPPRETARLLRRKFGRRRSWTAAELLDSAKHKNGGRFIDALLRIEAALAHTIGWTQLDFAGRRVIEVGCGPLLGFGPIAIFRGAAAFESADPEFDAALLQDPAIEVRYLRPLFRELVAVYGPRMDFTGFRDAVAKRCRVHPCGFEVAPLTSGTDIVLSNSCLEHLFALPAVLSKLAAIQTPLTRFVHAVDFGNHYPTDDPFEGLYAEAREAYIQRRPGAINLLRAPDIARAFRDAGIAHRMVAWAIEDPPSGEPIADWWRQRYDATDLRTRHALFVNA
jgi:hypothetical protein